MCIEKALVLSTAHITLAINNALEAGIVLPFRVQNHEYGFIFFLTEESLHEDNPLPELIPIISYAIKNGCTMINLDRDADIVEELPTYEW